MYHAAVMDSFNMGLCKHGNEPSGFIKGREFHGQLGDY
jgi:hypothetical protein